MKVCDFFKQTRIDCLAISYGTKHGANKGTDVTIRKEIAIASMENLKHENIFGVLVSHGSSTVPSYIVEEINQLGGAITNAAGIQIAQLKEVLAYGIGKINIDTDIRLAVTRNLREYFSAHPDKQSSGRLGEIWTLMKSSPEQFDPRAYLTPIMDAMLTGDIENDDVGMIIELMKRGVREIVGTMIVHFGSVGYAPKIEQVSLGEMASRYQREGI
jgi:fructose-bisphosphate aldolase class II